MKGYFENAQVSITAPNGEGMSAWLIHAKALHLSYEWGENGALTLRITEDRDVKVKEEPNDDEQVPKEEGAKPTDDGSGVHVQGLHDKKHPRRSKCVPNKQKIPLFSQHFIRKNVYFSSFPG